MNGATAEGGEHRSSRVLRVFFDWGHVRPLWEDGTDEYAMEPSDYGYSPALTEVLQQWQQQDPDRQPRGHRRGLATGKQVREFASSPAASPAPPQPAVTAAPPTGSALEAAPG